jgi:hypothetical protein
MEAKSGSALFFLGCLVKQMAALTPYRVRKDAPADSDTGLCLIVEILKYMLEGFHPKY